MGALVHAMPDNEVVRLDNLQLFVGGAVLGGTATLARRVLSPA